MASNDDPARKPGPGAAGSLARPQDLRWFIAQPWPGNERELDQVLRKALLLGEGGQLALPPEAISPAPLPWLSLSPRQHTALAQAQDYGEVSVGELVQQCGVSPG